MKKTTKFLLALGFASLCLTGCQPQIEYKEVEVPPKPKTISKDAKSTDLVKINLTGITGFGTRIGADAPKTKAAARAISDYGLPGGSETLVGFKADGSWEYALKKPEGLASWCEYQPVREVYQCTLPTAENGAKGIYIVFSSYIDFWEDEAGNKLAPIGQLMYVKPNGSIIDVFGQIQKETKITLDTRIKENDDWDYIKFDKAGNLFMLVKDEGVSKICRYNPLSNELTFKTLNVSNASKIYPLNFEVTSDGTYILLNTLINYEGTHTISVRGPMGVGSVQKTVETGENYVYAISVNSSTIKELYHPQATNRGREVSNVCYDSKNNSVYFGVMSYYTGCVGSGIHIWKQNSSGDFANERVFFSPQNWMWLPKEDLATDYTAKYEECKADTANGAANFLAYLKSFYGPSKDKVYFTLDFFRNYQNAEGFGEKKAYEIPPLDMDNVAGTTGYRFQGAYNPYDFLYKTNTDGAVLTELAAMQYLMNTTAADAPGFPAYVVTEMQKSNLSTLNDSINNILFSWAISGFNATYREEFETNGKDHKYEYTCNAKGPLWLFFTTNPNGIWTPETAAYPGYYDIENASQRAEAKAWCLTDHRSLDYVSMLANDDGVWTLIEACDNWYATGWRVDYTKTERLFDAEGKNTNTTTPDSVKNVQTYKLPHQWLAGDLLNRVNSDPWYKAPFKSLNNGFLLKDRSCNTLWYYNCATDTCSKVFDKSGFTIYSYALNNGILTVNGNTELGGSRTVKVNLSSSAQTNIGTVLSFETLIDVNIPAAN